MRDDEVRAHVLGKLPPNKFSDERDLQAYLQQQPPEQRAEKLEQQCGIQLGTAARYVQLFCTEGLADSSLTPQAKFVIIDSGDAAAPLRRIKFRTQAQYDKYRTESGTIGLQDASDPEANVLVELEELHDGATYDAVSLGTGTIPTMRGELDSHATCLEQKAGEKAVSVLVEEGHLGVELATQKRWTVRGGSSKEIDAMVVANECVLCVEVKLKAGLASVGQLLATLVFLRQNEDQPGFEMVKGKRLRGAIYTAIVNAQAQADIQQACAAGFEGQPFAIWLEGGQDISNGNVRLSSPTAGAQQCRAASARARPGNFSLPFVRGLPQRRPLLHSSAIRPRSKAAPPRSNASCMPVRLF